MFVRFNGQKVSPSITRPALAAVAAGPPGLREHVFCSMVFGLKRGCSYDASVVVPAPVGDAGQSQETPERRALLRLLNALFLLGCENSSAAA